MARPLRPDVPGAWHHVINRGADRQDIFTTDSDFVRFENLLATSVDEYGIEIHAYSLMSNHFHLLVHCPEGELSAALKQVQAQYASTYNYVYDRTGPLFEGRFTSITCDTIEHRHTVGRYIHRNPLDIVPVSALGAFRWSSLPVHLGRRANPGWVTTSELAAQFNDADAYLEYVTTEAPSDSQANRTQSGPAIARIDDLAQRVAQHCGVTVASLAASRQGSPNDPRVLLVTLAVELRLATSSTIAEHFNFAEASSVRSTARRGRVRLAADPNFASLRMHILNQAAA